MSMTLTLDCEKVALLHCTRVANQQKKSWHWIAAAPRKLCPLEMGAFFSAKWPLCESIFIHTNILRTLFIVLNKKTTQK